MTCANLSHSPRLHGTTWRCPDCDAERDQAPVARQPEAHVSVDDWAIFQRALREAVGPDGLVHQRDMRPLIRDRIKSQRIPSLYRRAISRRLITEAGRERSNDVRGRNTNKDEPYYALRSAA